MKIVLDARYAGHRPSGIGRYTEALLTRLPALGARVEAWLHPAAQLAAIPGVRRVTVAPRANHLPTLLWPAKLAPLGPDDVFHAPFNILGRGLAGPTVVTIHDLMWLETPQLCQPSWLRRLFQRPFFASGIQHAIARADWLITPSRATADTIVAREPHRAARIAVIPHGIEKRFRPAADPERACARCRALGLPGPFFLVVGQNAPYKNHDSVIAAYAASGLAPAVALAVVERLARGRRALPGVVRLGALADDDLLALMQSALALVQFSRNEGFGLPLLEAMACGTPAIVSDAPALVELAGGAAKVVPLRGAGLVPALRALAGDSGLRGALSAAGRERAAAFDWDTAAAAHFEIYQAAARR